VNITAHANLPAACCNDGLVQFGEQCDSGLPAEFDCAGNPVEAAVGSCATVVDNEVCHCDCLAKEILLTTIGAAPAVNNDPKTKRDLSLAFSGGSGSADVAGSLRVVYTDLSPLPGGTAPDINTRLLKSDLYPIVTAPLNQPLRLPRSCSGNLLITPQGKPRQEITPDISRISADKMAVAWADDELVAAQFDIFVVSQNDVGCTDAASDVQINVNKNESLSHPAVAGGPNDTALVVWADGGSLRGRVWTATADDTCNTCLPAAADIDLGTLVAGSHPRVAGNASGWVVAYAGAGVEGDVFIRTVSPQGAPGAERKVNLAEGGVQDQPDVAMQPDGSYAVVWSNGGVMMMQRYDGSGDPAAGDQDTPMSVGSPLGFEPAVAASGGAFYTAAWSAFDDGTVWARHIGIGEDRFLRNHVNATLDDFLANHPGVIGTRIHVDVAIGDFGGTTYAAIGWIDDSDTHPGAFVRRFPSPE